MSIASEITRINTNIENAYTACNGKGATMPVTQNSANLATCIGSIQTGGGGSTLITKSITQNGTYNASSDNADGYSSVTVNVVTAGQVRVVENGVYKKPTNNFTFTLPNNATDMGNDALANAFGGSDGVIDASFSSLITLSGENALLSCFVDCSNLTSLDFSNLTTISGAWALSSAFAGCSSLINLDFSSLVTISGEGALDGAFQGCYSLTSVDLSSLTTVSGYGALASVFAECPSLTNVEFTSLTNLTGSRALAYAFLESSSFTTLSFPALTSTSFGSYTDQFEMMLEDASDCTVHFPSNLQSVIGSWNDVVNGFGGTNTTILFDLPATE